ncbi:MAG: hypothetical protein MUF27_12630 [Acidobacteria bacterium]|jgi:hypothetical protein|nr:hypothetical protein [Acidobacteriota bacterium]
MFRKNAGHLALGLALLIGGAVASRAADEIRTERVHFKPGATSAVVEGSIKGYAIVDYLVNAREGQQMNASLATKHGATYFNILAPGETEVAMFNGSMGENQFEGTLPKSGDYKLRVYMMRSAARRNETANYRLEIIVTGGGAQSAAPKGDAKVPGTDFHATGKIPCSMGSGQPTGSCDFGVTREGGGSGMVTVTKPDGRKRVIYFQKGRATGYDQSQADTAEFRASRQEDLTIVQIGGERFEIPDAVINGG